MEEYLAIFVALVDGIKLSILVALILGNFLLALAVSIKDKKFRLKELGDLMISRIIPYVLGYFAVGIVGVVEPSWQAAIPVVWGVILLALVGAILQNLSELGIKLPDFLSGDKID